jgi:hypothetical protein|nr:hypothetical protein [Pseudomonas aeruginosa]
MSMLQFIRRMLGMEQLNLMEDNSTGSPRAMSDAELREWAQQLYVRCNTERLSSYGINPWTLLQAQLDDQALAEVRRWSGSPRPDMS